MAAANISSDAMNLNQDDYSKLTPLISVITNKAEVEALLNKGADVNFPSLKRVPQNIAKSRAGNPICRYPIEFAAACSTLDIIKLLLARGAMLENTNALHAAAGGVTDGDSAEQIKIMEFLLEKGLDINAIEFVVDASFPEQYEDRFYGTPLHYAAVWGWEDRFEFLLKKGADTKALGYSYKSKKQWGTPLDWQMLNEEDEGSYSKRIRDLLTVPQRVKGS
ncbi:hypothetical protein HK100_006281 [Physocladia obscura]|uniref:Ankyrin repeat domain-containing protein n=1 Tax=Physocladia obscura TaxID=109957 RepID=A0AAD5SST1_9FUNG|nr:hypothetical protein HK100_006281 [Physocladia obscura]